MAQLKSKVQRLDAAGDAEEQGRLFGQLMQLEQRRRALRVKGDRRRGLMALFGRRVRPPAGLRDLLAPDERLLAMAEDGAGRGGGHPVRAVAAGRRRTCARPAGEGRWR